MKIAYTHHALPFSPKVLIAAEWRDASNRRSAVQMTIRAPMPAWRYRAAYKQLRVYAKRVQAIGASNV